MIAFNSRVWFLMYILFLVFLSLPMFLKCFLVLRQFEPHVSYTHVSYIKKNAYIMFYNINYSAIDEINGIKVSVIIVYKST